MQFNIVIISIERENIVPSAANANFDLEYLRVNAMYRYIPNPTSNNKKIIVSRVEIIESYPYSYGSMLDPFQIEGSVSELVFS